MSMGLHRGALIPMLCVFICKRSRISLVVMKKVRHGPCREKTGGGLTRVFELPATSGLMASRPRDVEETPFGFSVGCH